MAIAVLVPVECALLFLVRLRRDDDLGLLCIEAIGQRVGVIRLIGQSRLRRDRFDPGLCLGDVAGLPASENETRQLAPPHPRGFSSSTRPENVPEPAALFWAAPAACWRARTTVLSRKTSSKPASSRNTAKTFFHTGLSDQRAKRTCTLFHAPNAAGESRHRLPVCAIHNTASTNRRLFAPLRPRPPGLPCNSGSIRAHWASRNIIRNILATPKYKDANTIQKKLTIVPCSFPKTSTSNVDTP